MNYAEIAAVYLVPSATPVPVPSVSPTPARRLRDALEPIATQGWWAKGVHARLEPTGIGFLDGYVWGRAAALGEPTAGVVAATFGVFEPTFLASVYEQGRAVIGRDAVLAAREEGAVESLEAVIAGTSSVSNAEVASSGDALLDACSRLDATARPLFSGLRDLAVPSSPAGRLWRGAELVREHRGDGHLGVCIAEGLDPLEMSIMTELWLDYGVGDYSSSRGYGPDAISAALARLVTRGWIDGQALTAEGRTARTRMEEVTDRTQSALVDALGDQLDVVVAIAERLSDAVVASGAFPSDPRKRAAG